MGSTTGIELGPDFCVLVAVRPRRTGPTDVLAFHTIERSEWPLRDAGLTEALRGARAAKKFPARRGWSSGVCQKGPRGTILWLRPSCAR